MERFWIAKLPPGLLNAPLASLAALAHRGELLLIVHVFFIVFFIVEIVCVGIDLSWMFMPTWLHVGLIFRLLGRLRASWGPLGTSWGALGRLLGALENSWVVLVGSSALLVGSGALLIGSWAALGRLLGASWALLSGSWALLGESWALLGYLGRLLGGS